MYVMQSRSLLLFYSLTLLQRKLVDKNIHAASQVCLLHNVKIKLRILTSGQDKMKD